MIFEILLGDAASHCLHDPLFKCFSRTPIVMETTRNNGIYYAIHV